MNARAALGNGLARVALAYLFIEAGRTVLAHPEGPAVPRRVTDKIKEIVPALESVPTTTFVRSERGDCTSSAVSHCSSRR